jgi:hypothetical protein
LLTVLGFRIDWITLHQGAFVVWGVATGLHLLGRIVPALLIVSGRATRGLQVPGRVWRGLGLTLALAAAVVSAVLLVHAKGTWGQRHDFGRRGEGIGQVLPPG